MKLKVSSGGVPVGSYIARFVGAEPTTTEYGEGLKWEFEIVRGPLQGQKTGRITSGNPTPKNACGKMLAGLVGRPIAAGEDIDLDAFASKSYLIVVAESEKGASRVDSVSLPPVG